MVSGLLPGNCWADADAVAPTSKASVSTDANSDASSLLILRMVSSLF